MRSSEIAADDLRRTCLLVSVGSGLSSRSRLRPAAKSVEVDADDMAENDAIEFPDSVRVRARTVCIVLPDASEKGDEGGRGAGEDVMSGREGSES